MNNILVNLIVNNFVPFRNSFQLPSSVFVVAARSSIHTHQRVSLFQLQFAFKHTNDTTEEEEDRYRNPHSHFAEIEAHY